MDETTASDVRAAMREAANQFLDTDMSDGSLHEIAYTLAAGFRDLDTGTVLTEDCRPAFTEDAPLVRHTHRHKGQVLKHSHEGGDRPHGYYEHPEDV